MGHWRVAYPLLLVLCSSGPVNGESYRIELNRGWNFLSLPIQPSVIPVITTQDLLRQLSQAGSVAIATNQAGSGDLRVLSQTEPSTMLRPGVALAVAASAPLTIQLEIPPAFPAPTIVTVAGNGTKAFGGDGGQAVEAGVVSPVSVALGPDNSLYIADMYDTAVRKVDLKTGIIQTVAGKPVTKPTTDPNFGEGGPATEARIMPAKVDVDKQGVLYIFADRYTILKVEPSNGLVYRMAGGGALDYDGQTGPAKQYRFNLMSMAVGPDGTVYIGQEEPGWIMMVPAGSDIIQPITPFRSPTVLSFDATNNRLYVTEFGAHILGYVDMATRKIVKVAGVEGGGHSGDGGPSSKALMFIREGAAVDRAGNLYVPEMDYNAIRRLDAATGIITTVAGDSFNRSENFPGEGRFFGDGGPADKASFYGPNGVCLDEQGYLYVADSANSRVRKLGPFPVGRAP